MNWLAKNIVLLRKLINFTQSEISDQLGFRRTTYNNYERGVSTPSLEDVFKIAKYFGFSVEELVMMDLSADVNLIAKIAVAKKPEKVNLNVNASVNPIRRKEVNTDKETPGKDAFKSLLNEDQASFKHLSAEVYEIARKQALFEHQINNKIAVIEAKLDELLKDKP